MAKRKKCGTINSPGDAECSGCGVILAHTRRGEERSEGPILCSWNDYGRGCHERGILSFGAGWYCREHQARLEGREPECIGNGLPPAKHSRPEKFAGWEWNAKLKRLVRVDSNELAGQA